jgi:hypothetical protein
MHPSGTALFLCALALATTVSTAPAADSRLEVAPADTLRDTLVKQQGKAVKLRLRGGDELDGKVVMVGDAIVRLGELVGREFYDAVVDLSSIQAVVVRAR